jgi:hypothetical protein
VAIPEVATADAAAKQAIAMVFAPDNETGLSLTSGSGSGSSGC